MTPWMRTEAFGQCDLLLGEDVAAGLKAVQHAPKADDFAALSALESLETQLKSADRAASGSAGQVVVKLVEVGWRGLFSVYYGLKDQRVADAAGGAQ